LAREQFEWHLGSISLLKIVLKIHEVGPSFYRLRRTIKVTLMMSKYNPNEMQMRITWNTWEHMEKGAHGEGCV